ncbi:MAG: hypothetical protein M0036_19175 [Desulfobacteraceae bacterium]|nr:hypothetical protein [Desulfobacteraceae bacterium]
MPTNQERIERAMTAMSSANYGENDSLDAGMCDLIADLLHFCAQEGLDFDSILNTARMHFEAESEEEED